MRKNCLYIFILYIITFGVFLPLLCTNLSFSIFFREPKDSLVIEEENSQRYDDALEYFKHKETMKLHMLNKQNAALKQRRNMDFCVVVLTVARTKNAHYLIQVAKRLHETFIVENDIIVNIYNAEQIPKSHLDARFLSTFFPVHQHSGNDNETQKSSATRHTQQCQDFIQAMKTCTKLNPRYIIFLEDDALPLQGFFNSLRTILFKHNLSHQLSKWAFLKLYYPEKWQGFGIPEIPELFCIGVVGGFVLSIIFMKPFRRFDKKKYILIFALLATYSILLAVSVGRQHWLEILRVFFNFHTIVKAPGCCMPAVLFPQVQAVKLLDFVSKKTCSAIYPLDIAIDDYADFNSLQRYLVLPVLFSHIGLHSSISRTDKSVKEFGLLVKP